MRFALWHKIARPETTGRTQLGGKQAFEYVGCCTPKASCQAAQQVEVDRDIPSIQSCLRIGDVLRAAGVALHCYEVLETNHAQGLALKRDLDRAGKGVGIEASKTDQQLHGISARPPTTA